MNISPNVLIDIIVPILVFILTCFDSIGLTWGTINSFVSEIYETIKKTKISSIRSLISRGDVELTDESIGLNLRLIIDGAVLANKCIRFKFLYSFMIFTNFIVLIYGLVCLILKFNNITLGYAFIFVSYVIVAVSILSFIYLLIQRNLIDKKYDKYKDYVG